MPLTRLSLLALALAVSLPALAEGTAVEDRQEDPPKAEESSAPETAKPLKARDKWSEAVAVTAAADDFTEGPLGATSTVVKPEETGGTPSAVTDLAVQVPGVSENGQGGLFQVFSVRGVSRQRVTHLVSGMRITTDRRAGASTSFIDPLLMGSVEVLRGPSTTLHGSGALGGVVQIMPRDHDGGSVSGGYATNGDERYVAAGTGGERWSVGLAHREADDGEAPDGEVLNSHFTQTSAVLSYDWGRGKLRYALMAIPTYATDIGKANTDFPERTTEYPFEQHGLLRFGVESGESWHLRGFVHAQELETLVTEPSLRSTVTNNSFDYGAYWERDIALNGDTAVRVGVDLFGRTDVNADEVRRNPDDPDDGQTLRSLDDARETEAAGFATLRWNWGRTTLETGGRLTWMEQGNAGDPVRDDSEWSGFLGLSAPLNNHLRLQGSLSTGVRFPSLTELFYTGTTGRGEVVGNPDLAPERSFNAELSLRWLSQHLLVEGAVYRNRIDEYIERIEVAPDLLTWINVTSGVIRGAELAGTFRPASKWQVGFGGHFVQGDSDDGQTLSDIPPAELFAGGGYDSGPWRALIRLTHRFDKTDVGSGEKPIPAAQLLEASIAYQLTPRWNLALTGTNLLDEEYYRSADDKAPLAQGRSIGFQFRWQDG